MSASTKWVDGYKGGEILPRSRLQWLRNKLTGAESSKYDRRSSFMSCDMHSRR